MKKILLDCKKYINRPLSGSSTFPTFDRPLSPRLKFLPRKKLSQNGQNLPQKLGVLVSPMCLLNEIIKNYVFCLEHRSKFLVFKTAILGWLIMPRRVCLFRKWFSGNVWTRILLIWLIRNLWFQPMQKCNDLISNRFLMAEILSSFFVTKDFLAPLVKIRWLKLNNFCVNSVFKIKIRVPDTIDKQEESLSAQSSETNYY